MTDIDTRLQEVADLADPLAMPAPSVIRHGGDRRRWNRRVVVAGALTAVALLVAGTTLLTDSSRQSAPPAGGNQLPDLPGWHVARRISVANDGHLLWVDGALWVTDRAESATTDDVPDGATYILDPRSGEVRETLEGAVGAWPALGGGAVWFNTQATSPPVVTRVDLATHQISRIPVPIKPFLVSADDQRVWVASYDDGTVVELDPGTGAARGEPVKPVGWYAGLLGWSAADDRTFFAPDYESSDVLRIDKTTGQSVSVVSVPGDGRGALALAGGTLYVGGQGVVYAVDVSQVGKERVLGFAQLTPTPTDEGTVNRVVVGNGAVWAVSEVPSKLYRIDPETMQVTGTYRIPGRRATNKNFGRDVVTGDGAVWVRSVGRVIELRPDR